MSIKLQKDEIIDKLKELFGDTSVSPGKTRAALEEIREEIEGMLEVLPPEE